MSMKLLTLLVALAPKIDDMVAMVKDLRARFTDGDISGDDIQTALADVEALLADLAVALK